MGAGRFACVALPLALTIASIVCLLIAMLGGIVDKNMSLFEVRTQNLSISSSSLQNLADTITRRDIDLSAIGLGKINTDNLSVADITAKIKAAGATGIDNVEQLAQDIKDGKTTDVSDILNNASGDLKDKISSKIDDAIGGTNLTAKNLNLADYYKVSLWGYCSWKDGNRNCTKASFDWASSKLNDTAYTAVISDTGVTVNLPKDVKAALKTFGTVSKWTQVVYIVAIIAAATELIFGLFAICSRIGSCCTYIVAAIATTAIICASVLATVLASVTTGAIKATAKAYSVDATINTNYLVATWAAAAFSLGAGLFWLFTICCCAPSDKKKKSSGSSRGFAGFGKGKGHGDTEKLIPGGSGYSRVGDDHHTEYRGSVPMKNVHPQRAAAYEPYNHTRV